MQQINEQKSKCNQAKPIVFYLCSFIIALILSGCSSPFAKTEIKPDVLLAQECGMDGLKCCATSPQCSFGQACCVNPRNSEENYCADKCDFGSEGQYCRNDGSCGSGMKCLSSKCAKCGGVNQVCCGQSGDSDGRCAADDKNVLVCQAEVCVACGEIGHPCCAGLCDGTDKKQQLAQCQNDLCVACGGNGQAACSSEPKCALGYLFSNTFCYVCGGANQPCCEKSSCHTDKLICTKGFCKNH